MTRESSCVSLGSRDYQNGEALTQSDLVSESSWLIVAGNFDDPQVIIILLVIHLLIRLIGADSIDTALAASFFYPVHNPATLIKHNNEVCSIFWSLEDIVLRVLSVIMLISYCHS